jgi:hypothetical protein
VQRKDIFAILVIAGLLPGCAQMSPLEPSYRKAILIAEKDSRTPNDHVALAELFEGAATQLTLKAEEQKRLLKRYQEKHYLYGWLPHDIEAHTQALIWQYEHAAGVCAEAAITHRTMASEAVN